MTDLADLAEKASAAITASQRQVLDTARAMLNEAGLTAARRSLADAMTDLADAQEKVRQVADNKRTAQQAHDDAFTSAQSMANFDHIDREGNKTFWIGDDGDRRQVTADEARDLARQQAHNATGAQRQALEHFDQQLAAARDGLDLAKTRISVARSELSAAVAHVQLFAGVLGEIGANQ